MLPYGRQVIEEDDIAAVVRVLKGDMLTTGPEVPAFEAEFAAYTGAAHAVACSSGTAGLHLAAMALGLGPNDQVIVPTVSFVATANAPSYCGAEVVFADVDPLSGLATPDTVAEAIGRADPARLKAIFVVHLAGVPVDLPGIAALAARHGVPVIEDACHALGGTYRHGADATASVGGCTHSVMSVFSTHPVKTITTGEGGVVTTNDSTLYEAMLLLRSHGLVRDPARWRDSSLGIDPPTGNPNPWVYELQALGYNYRITDFQAALGRTQLAKMPRFAEVRRRLAVRYHERLAAPSPRVRTYRGDAALDPVLHLMVARIDFAALGQSRAQVMKALHGKGVGTQVHYIPIHRQPHYQRMARQPELPGSARYYATCLSLPLYASMTEADVDHVVEALGSVVGGAASR